MFNKILLFTFCSFVFSEKVIFQIENTNIYDYDFYETVPFSEWVVLDSSKQRLSKNSFLEKELVFFESLEKKINIHGETYAKLKQRESQLLINFAYENFVAYPLIKESDLLDAKKHIKDRRFVYHLLLGYDGCSMPGVFTKKKGAPKFHAEPSENHAKISYMRPIQGQKLKLSKVLSRWIFIP